MKVANRITHHIILIVDRLQLLNLTMTDSEVDNIPNDWSRDLLLIL